MKYLADNQGIEKEIGGHPGVWIGEYYTNTKGIDIARGEGVFYMQDNDIIEGTVINDNWRGIINFTGKGGDIQIYEAYMNTGRGKYTFYDECGRIYNNELLENGSWAGNFEQVVDPSDVYFGTGLPYNGGEEIDLGHMPDCVQPSDQDIPS